MPLFNHAEKKKKELNIILALFSQIVLHIKSVLLNFPFLSLDLLQQR